MIIDSIKELREILSNGREQHKTIGLVPTMGYLHDGHLSLIESAKRENDIVVVSVFVNPTQFAPNEDYEAYPRDIERDAQLATNAGATIVFHPSVAEIYPNGSSTFVEVEGDITKLLCGKSRPTHFKGVTTVVNMLFNIVKPDRAYFGQKDAQQVAVLQKMVNELHIDVEMVVCPIVREADGLALSSRNIYLTSEEREEALVLSKSLNYALSLFQNGERDANALKREIKDMISTKKRAEIDYVEIYRYPTLLPTERIEERSIIALAVRFGKTRLIDNTILELK